MLPAQIKSIISHVSIIMKRIRIYCSIFVGQYAVNLFYDKQKNTWMLGNMKFISRVEQDISFALLTGEISWSTLKINFISPFIKVVLLYQ